MNEHVVEQFRERQARHKAYKERMRPFIIQPKAKAPALSSYVCKCGTRVSNYQSYHGGDFLIFLCNECGRIRRFTTLTETCKFCGKHEEMDDGMMHEYGHGYGDYWMCPKCANDGKHDAHRERLDKRMQYADYDWRW